VRCRSDRPPRRATPSDRPPLQEFTIGRYNYLFCGAKGNKAACTLHLSVLGYDEETSFSLIVYGLMIPLCSNTSPLSGRAHGTSTICPVGLESTWKNSPSTLCAPGCEWLTLGDGKCDPRCNVEPCFFDRGDCDCGGDGEAECDSGCPIDCKPEWIGDHFCDEACFRAACSWDARDCLQRGEEACADDCLPSSIGDGECDAACNVESCGFDGSDCFKDHDECYQVPRPRHTPPP